MALSMLLATIATAGLIGHLATGAALVQLAVAPRMRGRVVATYDFGRLSLLALGSLFAGAVTDVAGASAALLLFGALTVAGVVLVRILDPVIARIFVDDDGRIVVPPETSSARSVP